MQAAHPKAVPDWTNRRAVRIGSPPTATEAFGICCLCGGPTQPGSSVCFCCRSVVRRLQQPLVNVRAVTSFQVGDDVHYLLRGYKDAPDTTTRTACTTAIATLVDHWLAGDGSRWWSRLHSTPALVTAVPSAQRSGKPPVERLIEAVPELASRYRPLLIPGPAPTDHLVASRQGFSVPSLPRKGGIDPGTCVLVVDDTFTTGARVQSAVAALRVGGLQVGGALVVGRAVAPDSSPWQRAYWRATAVGPRRLSEG